MTSDNGKLIFPTKFDLESGVKDAVAEIPAATKKIQAQLDKTKLKMGLTFDIKSLDNIDKIEAKIKELNKLKLEPISEETRTALTELISKLNGLGAILSKLNTLNARLTMSADAARAVRTTDQHRIAEEKLAKAKLQTAQAAVRLQAAIKRQSDTMCSGNKILGIQTGYLNRLIQRMTVYASIGAITGFVNKVREVTAQFELQRISLGAIVQDQDKANQLFSQIKTFALKSPVSILDFTTYTKQVAAYGIEYEKLFDTTKRLADVSLGLGVDMQRLVLFYGQVRAAGYLRASELRQATEAGIPLVEKLAVKLSEVNGHATSAAEVMDLISKRAISFEMVEDIFKDMTSAGGMFYEMQEKQGNTLYGLWEKLGDAAQVMLNELGGTSAVNGTMKGLINVLTSVMRNWRVLNTMLTATVPVMATLITYNKLHNKTLNLRKIADKEVEKSEKMLAQAERELAAATKSGTDMDIARAEAARDAAAGNVAAAKAEAARQKNSNAWTRMKGGISDFFKANVYTLAATGIAAVVGGIVAWYQAATKLRKELEGIRNEGAVETAKSVSNFLSLANVVTQSADGTAKQRDALEELKRTYGEIIPVEDLTVEKLRAMNGEYHSLTDAIKEYIAQRTLQKQVEAIEEDYGVKIEKLRKSVMNSGDTNFMYGNIGVSLTLSDEQKRKLLAGIEEFAKDSALTYNQVFIKALNEYVGISKAETQYGSWLNLDFKDTKFKIGDASAIHDIIEAYREQSDAINDVTNEADKHYNKFGSYNKALESLQGAMEKVTVTAKEGTFAFDMEKTNAQINEVVNTLKQMLQAASTDLAANGIFFSDLSLFGDYKSLDSYAKSVGEYLKGKGVDIQAIISEVLADTQQKYKEGQITQQQYNLTYTKGLMDRYMEEVKRYGGQIVPPEGLYSIIPTWDTKDPEGRSSIDISPLINAIQDKLPLLKGALMSLQGTYEKLAPTDATLRIVREKMYGIVDDYGVSMDTMKRYLKRSGEDWETYVKRIKAALDDEIQKHREVRQERIDSLFFGIPSQYSAQDEKDQNELVKALSDLYGQMRKYYDPEKSKKGGKKGSKQDERLSILQEVASTLKTINKEYDDLSKKESRTSALADIKGRYADTFKNIQTLSKKYKFNLPEFDVPTDTKTLVEYLTKVREAISKLPKSEKAKLSLQVEINKLQTDELQKQIEAKLKKLSDKVAKSKTALEFYDKILKSTGDYEAALNVTVAIYGENGNDMRRQIAEQFKMAFEGVDISQYIDPETFKVDLRKIIEINDKEGKNLIESRKTLRDQLIANEQKISVDIVQTWQKDLEKAQSYAAKRIELSRYTAMQIAKINANPELTGGKKENMIQGYRERESKEAAKLEYESFKDSPMYVKMFDDIDKASTRSLENMRKRLVQLQSVWGKSLDPTQLKEMQTKLNDINTQLATKSPFSTLNKSLTVFQQLRRKFTSKKDLEKKLQGENGLLDKYKDSLNMANTAYEEYASKNGGEDDIAKSLKQTVELERQKVEEQEKSVNSLQEELNRWDSVKGLIKESVKQAVSWGGTLQSGLQAAADIMEEFGADAEDIQFVQDLAEGIGKVTEGLTDMAQALLDFDIQGFIESVFTSLPKLISGFGQLFNAGKIRAANKEIKRQQEILNNLQYTLGRYQKAAEKLLGSDWLSNYNQQLSNLEAQQLAYQKQLEAEQSKGKKADKDKIKEYEENLRDIKDQIEDIYGTVSTQMLGSDLASFAKDMAQAALEAYKTFSNMSDAISDKWQETLQSMVANSVLAKVMQRALSPVYEMIDEMNESDFYNEEFWRKLSAVAAESSEEAAAGAQTMLQFLEKAGISMRDTTSELTGITRDYATASEESINGLATAYNTMNYFVSGIYDNTNIMLQLMQQQGGAAASGSNSDLTALQNDHLAYLPNIAANTADMVARCERAASACETMATKLGSVIGTPTGAPSKVVYVKYKA